MRKRERSDSQAGVHEERHGHVLVLDHLLFSQLDGRDRLPGRQARVLQFRQQFRGPAPAGEDGQVRFEMATVGGEDTTDVGVLRVERTEEEGLGFGGDELDAEGTGAVDRTDDGIARGCPAADVIPVWSGTSASVIILEATALKDARETDKRWPLGNRSSRLRSGTVS